MAIVPATLGNVGSPETPYSTPIYWHTLNNPKVFVSVSSRLHLTGTPSNMRCLPRTCEPVVQSADWWCWRLLHTLGFRWWFCLLSWWMLVQLRDEQIRNGLCPPTEKKVPSFKQRIRHGTRRSRRANLPQHLHKQAHCFWWRLPARWIYCRIEMASFQTWKRTFHILSYKYDWNNSALR